MKLSLLRKLEKANGGTLSNKQSEIRFNLSKLIARMNCRKLKTPSISTWCKSMSSSRRWSSLKMLMHSNRMRSLVKLMRMKSWNSRRWSWFSKMAKEWPKLKKRWARFKFKKLGIPPNLMIYHKNNNSQTTTTEVTAILAQYLAFKNLAAMIKHMKVRRWRRIWNNNRRLRKKDQTWRGSRVMSWVDRSALVKMQKHPKARLQQVSRKQAALIPSWKTSTKWSSNSKRCPMNSAKTRCKRTSIKFL